MAATFSAPLCWGSRAWRTGFGLWKLASWGTRAFLPGAPGDKTNPTRELLLWHWACKPDSLSSGSFPPWHLGFAAPLCWKELVVWPWQFSHEQFTHYCSLEMNTFIWIPKSVPKWAVLNEMHYFVDLAFILRAGFSNNHASKAITFWTALHSMKKETKSSSSILSAATFEIQVVCG